MCSIYISSINSVWLTSQTSTSYSAQKELAKDLWEAVDNDDVIKVRSLLGQGADPNHQLYWSDECDPPLHWACYKGYLEIVKTLVTHGARTDKGDGRDNMTPLHWACLRGHKEIVKYLIQEVGCSTGKYRSIQFKAAFQDLVVEKLCCANCVIMPRCSCASEVYGSVCVSVCVCVCVCVNCYSCSRINEVQVRVSIGF